jgi:hypothetical protein
MILWHKKRFPPASTIDPEMVEIKNELVAIRRLLDTIIAGGDGHTD